MSRLELGRVAFKERDISDLLVYYGVTDPEQRDDVLRLVREANRPSWWREFDDVMPQYLQNYIGLEEAASTLRTYEIHFVPGLLQTPEYARAVLSSTIPPLKGRDLERAVTLRLTRQQVLEREDPLTVWAVVDESALAFPTVMVSAGRRGLQVELPPAELVRLTRARTAPIGR